MLQIIAATSHCDLLGILAEPSGEWSDEELAAGKQITGLRIKRSTEENLPCSIKARCGKRSFQSYLSQVRVAMGHRVERNQWARTAPGWQWGNLGPWCGRDEKSDSSDWDLQQRNWLHLDVESRPQQPIDVESLRSNRSKQWPKFALLAHLSATGPLLHLWKHNLQELRPPLPLEASVIRFCFNCFKTWNLSKILHNRIFGPKILHSKNT